jgi:hypothetical protein
MMQIEQAQTLLQVASSQDAITVSGHAQYHTNSYASQGAAESLPSWPDEVVRSHVTNVSL